MMLRILVALAALVAAAQSAFIIGYHQGAADNQEIVNAGASFSLTPTPEQVADIYARTSGLPPLLWEDQANLPAANILSSKIVKPQIIEVVGGALPASVTPMIQSASALAGPALSDVVNVLNQNGVQVDVKKFVASGDRAVELQKYLSTLAVPAIVLHHSGAPARRLSDVTEPTEFEISDYQICLWAGLVFVVLLLSSICGLMNMDVQPDSLLYAKFQSGRTDGKRD